MKIQDSEQEPGGGCAECDQRYCVCDREIEAIEREMAQGDAEARAVLAMFQLLEPVKT